MRLLFVILFLSVSISVVSNDQYPKGQTDNKSISDFLKEQRRSERVKKRNYFDNQDGMMYWEWKYDVYIDTLEYLGGSLDIFGVKYIDGYSPNEEYRVYTILRIDSVFNNLVVFYNMEINDDIGMLLTDNQYKFSLGELYGYSVYDGHPTLVLGNKANMYFKKSGLIHLSPIYSNRIENDLDCMITVNVKNGFYLQRNGKFEFIDTGEDKNSGIQERSYLEYIRRNLPKDE